MKSNKNETEKNEMSFDPIPPAVQIASSGILRGLYLYAPFLKFAIRPCARILAIWLQFDHLFQKILSLVAFKCISERLLKFKLYLHEFKMLYQPLRTEYISHPNGPI